jgi:AcrR family transcriptional regulator
LERVNGDWRSFKTGTEDWSFPVRVKREAVRQAILAAAAEEFSRRGYLKTTMGQIARRAGTAPSNIYVYYKSKLEIAVAVYEPWFRKQIILLERAVGRKRSPALKIQCLVDGILHQIPNEKRGLTTTLVQALATARPTDVYSPELLQWTEGKIAEIIQSSFRETGRKPADLSTAHILMLMFDAIALRRNLRPVISPNQATLKAVTAMVLKKHGK